MSLLRTIELDGDPRLYGRNKETKLLLDAYARCKDEKGNGAPECVLITGASGMGKTSLVQKALRPTVVSDRGMFLSGKFELSPHYQPYEVIVSAFAQLSEQLMADERVSKIREAILAAIGAEGRILTDVIPGLESMIGEPVVGTCGSTESLSRFQFVFSEFCRAVSSVVPLVIFLDDMQWCDQASLELVQALLRPKLCSLTESKPSSSLLLVAASRDEHVTQESGKEEKSAEDGTFSPTFIATTFAAKSSRNIFRIHLACLNPTETKDLIAKNFGLSDEAAQVLASLAFAKCGGNILHTLQYVRSIPNIELTNVDHCVQCIEAKTINTSHGEPEEEETVEKIILKRVQKLPTFTKELLLVAGCIGNVIDETALCNVSGVPLSEISPALEFAAKEELLEFEQKRSQYRFIHDSVRQAVMSMIVDKDAMSFRIGHKLWQQSSSNYVDSNLFTIVNLLNKGINSMSKKECYEVANLNLIAGRRAASKVSFRDASYYFKAGIDILKLGDLWTDQYDLALQLHNAAAGAELSNRNFRNVEILIEDVFQHARCFKDKLSAYASQIVATGQQGKVVEATNIGLEVLRQLGEQVPDETRITDIRAELIETERALRGRSNADILSLPYMEDEDKEATMRFLLMMIPYSLEAGSPYGNWIATRVVRLTLSHGLSKGCAHGFATYARFICKTNAKLGYNYGQLAAFIVEKCGAKELMPRVYISLYSMTSHWTRPLRESLSPLQSAFEVAVENGDVEYALIAAFFRSLFSLYVSVNLVQVERLLKETRRHMSSYKMSLVLHLTSVTLQFVHNLMGKAPDQKVLAGDAFSHEDRELAGSSAVAYLFFGFSCKLTYLFCELDLADQFARELYELDSRADFSSYSFAVHQFQVGLVAIAQARRGINFDENLERSQLCVKKLVGWARDCPHNFLNKKALLDAELASLQPHATVDNKIVSLYDQAIEGALEEGFLEEAAIACERAGDYMDRQQNTAEATRFWNRAQRIFRRWGATAKVEALKARAATALNCHNSESSPSVECAT